MRLRARSVVLGAALALAPGCLKPEVEPSYLPAYEPFDPTDPSWSSTLPVLLVSDCQVFNLLTEPVPERNLSSQSMVPTAIRSPQLNLYTPDVLRFILADEQVPTKGVLHLGDALDLGCEGEFETFLDAMSGSGRPWLMVPGNHDCTYFGNYVPALTDNWSAGCTGAGAPMTKDLFVRLYVAALLKQEGEGFAALARDLGFEAARELPLRAVADRLPLEHRYEAPEGSRAYLEAIAWNIDEERPWRSFVMQRANLDGEGERAIPCCALLLDSCQYELQPTMLPNAWRSYPLPLNAGFTGEMLGDQLALLREWLVELESKNRVGLLAFHHPLDFLAARTRANLNWLVEHGSTADLFVTAHTHRGHFEYHDIGQDRQLVELNVGSTTDWPMEWRTLAIYYRERDGARQAYMQTRRFTLAERLRNEPGYFEAGWEVPFGELDDYRGYRQGRPSASSITDIYLGYHLKPFFLGPAHVRPREGARDTEAQYKLGLLSTHDRLLRLFPTDVAAADVSWPAGCASDAEVRERIERASAKEAAIDERIALLAELEPFERARHSRDPESGESTDAERLRFKLSQAVWASRYEYTRGRTLQPEDELVRVRLPETKREGLRARDAQPSASSSR